MAAILETFRRERRGRRRGPASATLFARQKEERVRQFKVDIPQEAFIQALAMGNELGCARRG